MLTTKESAVVIFSFKPKFHEYHLPFAARTITKETLTCTSGARAVAPACYTVWNRIKTLRTSLSLALILPIPQFFYYLNFTPPFIARERVFTRVGSPIFWGCVQLRQWVRPFAWMIKAVCCSVDSICLSAWLRFKGQFHTRAQPFEAKKAILWCNFTQIFNHSLAEPIRTMFGFPPWLYVREPNETSPFLIENVEQRF